MVCDMIKKSEKWRERRVWHYLHADFADILVLLINGVLFQFQMWLKLICFDFSFVFTQFAVIHAKKLSDSHGNHSIHLKCQIFQHVILSTCNALIASALFFPDVFLSLYFNFLTTRTFSSESVAKCVLHWKLGAVNGIVFSSFTSITVRKIECRFFSCIHFSEMAKIRFGKQMKWCTIWMRWMDLTSDTKRYWGWQVIEQHSNHRCQWSKTQFHW